MSNGRRRRPIRALPAPLFAHALECARSRARWRLRLDVWAPRRFLSPLDDDRRLVGRREVGPADRAAAAPVGSSGSSPLTTLGGSGDERLRLAPEGRLEDLVHRVDQDELDRLADLLRDVAQVLLVLARQDDDLGARQVRGQDLALEPADREDPTAQRDLAGHRHVLADGDAGEGADDGRSPS